MTTLRIFDNGGKTLDRYTIAPPRSAYKAYCNPGGLWECIGANDRPFHPQGIGQHTTCVVGRHLGKRVAFAQLPSDVQKFARQAFPEFVKETTHAK